MSAPGADPPASNAGASPSSTVLRDADGLPLTRPVTINGVVYQLPLHRKGRTPAAASGSAAAASASGAAPGASPSAPSPCARALAQCRRRVAPGCACVLASIATVRGALALSLALAIYLVAIFVDARLAGSLLLIVAIVAACRNTTAGWTAPGTLSAYSIFNPRNEAIAGSLTAAQFDAEIRGGAGAVAGLRAQADGGDDDDEDVRGGGRANFPGRGNQLGAARRRGGGNEDEEEEDRELQEALLRSLGER